MQKKQHIEYVKRQVSDLFETNIHGLNLATLELSRRFFERYRRYRLTQNNNDFEELYGLALKIDKRLLQEEELFC